MVIKGNGVLKMSEYNIKIKLPVRLEQIAVMPVLLYRWVRFGYAFRLIPLSQDKFAIVDADDYEKLRKYKWYARKSLRTYYAVCYISGPKYLSRRNVYMHHLVIDIPDGMCCDHINHNGLDNRKANLRAATQLQNLWNRRKYKSYAHSVYKGVDWARHTRRWRSRISVYGKRLHLGHFNNEIEAAKAYDEAAKKYFGDFANLNFATKT